MPLPPRVTLGGFLTPDPEDLTMTENEKCMIGCLAVIVILAIGFAVAMY